MLARSRVRFWELNLDFHFDLRSERVHAGLNRTGAQWTERGKPIGWPKFYACSGCGDPSRGGAASKDSTSVETATGEVVGPLSLRCKIVRFLGVYTIEFDIRPPLVPRVAQVKLS